MKVLDLRCQHGHRFEGWFSSDQDLQSQTEAGLMECPVCADKTITRLPSAPRLNVSGARETPAHARAQQEAAQQSGGSAGAATGGSQGEGGNPAAAPVDMTMQAAWLRAVQHVMKNTDDVGDRFAEEARRMHYGEADERAIRGRATPDEAEALKEEGIDVVSLPMPAAFKGPIQ
jgi:hypothetical protein